MKKHILANAVILILCLSFIPDALSFDGPLQVRNQFPLFINLDSQYLETAALEDSFSASLSHSSTFMMRNSTAWSVNIDMELTELTLRYKKNIDNILELGIDVPLLSMNSGFMDGILASYHKIFGFSDYGRSTRPKNEFLYDIRKNGSLILKGKGGRTDIGDIRVSAKKMIFNSDPVISLKADIELPTGSASKGFGSGSIDTCIAILMDKKLSEEIKTYLNLGAIFPGNLKWQEPMTLKNFVYAGAGVEAALWKNGSLLGQIFFQRSPFTETGISSIDRTAVLLSLGGRYSAGNNSLELSFTEDPNTAGAPDISLNLTFRRRF